MKLPVIRSLTEYIETHDEQAVLNTVDVLEHVSQAKSLKPEELEVIGELISNLCGSVEVAKDIRGGKSKSDAMNGFMQRVMGSIDR